MAHKNNIRTVMCSIKQSKTVWASTS